MYICLKTTENTEKILKAFEERGIKLNVRKGEMFTFIDCGEAELNGFLGLVMFYCNCLVFGGNEEFTPLQIPFSEIETIYKL